MVNLEGIVRFRAFLSARDVLLDPAETERDPTVFAVDRSGGHYRVVAVGMDRAPGVWHDDSEGESRRLASSPRELFLMLGRGCTYDDVVAGGVSPSGRPVPGLLAWAEALDESD